MGGEGKLDGQKAQQEHLATDFAGHEAYADITDIAASSSTFVHNHISIKERITIEDGTGKYFLEPAGPDEERKHLVTMRWVSPVTIKMSCEIHKCGTCCFMANSNCWEQIDREALHLAALAASYSSEGNHGRPTMHKAVERLAFVSRNLVNS